MKKSKWPNSNTVLEHGSKTLFYDKAPKKAKNGNMTVSIGPSLARRCQCSGPDYMKIYKHSIIQYESTWYLLCIIAKKQIFQETLLLVHNQCS